MTLPSEQPGFAPAGHPQSSPLAFDSLPLPEPVRLGIQHVGFTHCTPIQERILPLALAGRDVAGQAQTGTGKTAAFLITIYTRLIEHGLKRRPAAPRALVVAPTRELVVQIASDAQELGIATGFRIQAVFGGVDYRKQREGLGQDVDLLVGTPGRLIDYFKQRVYDLRAVEAVVIDEADRMFDMGFIRDLRFILRQCPPVERRQAMLFSATLSHRVMELAYMHMNDAVKVEINPEQVTAEGVEHMLYHVGLHEKLPALLGLLKREGPERTLIFVNMRRTADRLQRTLEANGYAAEQITGDIEQRRRLRILEDFREGRLPILIATDVASRGLHIENVTHVINYDVPLDPEDYVHRVGRTARAGASGKAIMLACEDYVEGVEAIEQLIGFKLPHDFPEDDMLVTPRSMPRERSHRPRAHDAGRGDSDRRGRRREHPSGDEPRGRQSRRGGEGTVGKGAADRREEAKPATAQVDAPSRRDANAESAGATHKPRTKRRRRRKRRSGRDGAPDARAPAAIADGRSGRRND